MPRPGRAAPLRRIRRLLLALAAALALAAPGLAGLPSAAAAAPAFSDVPSGYWAAADISALAAQGILEGTGGGLFQPNAPVSRAAFASMLARLANPPADTVGPPFADVPASAWFASAVADATGLGWMAGISADDFGPDQPLTRAMAAAAVAGYLGLQHVAADEPAAALTYADAAAIPAADRGAAVVAAQLGVLTGAPLNRFLPGQALTRAEAAALLVRLQGVRTAALQSAGARVAAYVDVDVTSADVESGGAMQLTAYAHDAAGYIVPAAFVWSAAGGGALVPEAGSASEGEAELDAGTAGTVQVTARASGVSVAGTATLHVTKAARLSVSDLPPAVLSSSSLPVPVRALQASGAVDAGSGATVTATATPAAAGTAPISASVKLSAGTGTLTLPPLPAGSYLVRVAAPGLAPVQASLESVAQPLGSLALAVQGGGTAVAAGGTATITAEVLPPPGPSGAGASAAAAAGAPSGAGASTAATGAPSASAAGASGAASAGAAPGAAASAAGGAGAAGAAAPAAGGPWPLRVSVSGAQTALPALTGEGNPPETLSVHVASAALPAAGGPAAVIAGAAPGQGKVTVAVPGGALTGATLALQVTPDGAFGAPLPAAPVTAGQPASVAIAVAPAAPGGTAGPVQLEPIDPAGHPLSYVTATVAGGVATAAFTPDQAGVWTFRWRGDDLAPVAAGSLTVAAAAPVSLVVDAVPTTVLLPGQTATLRAYEADAFGNPAAAAFTISGGALAGGTAAAGSVDFQAGAMAGPGTIGTFTAGGAGTATYTFQVSGLPAASVTFRTVASRADRVAGKGGWLIFPDWEDVSDAALLQQAKAEGYTHIYLEVATTSDGFYGGRALDDLLPKAHAAGIAVIAWVYAGLENPAADTAVLQKVAAYTTPGGDRADGVALDLEEVLSAPVVGAYTAAANQAEGPDGLVVAVTYPPQYGPSTPMAAIAPNVQVIAPMDYWHRFEADYSYDNVYLWVAASVAEVRSEAGVADFPVEVIAQAYDMFAGSGEGIFSPTPAELAASMRAAANAGALGVSFYRQTTATPAEQAEIAGSPWAG